MNSFGLAKKSALVPTIAFLNAGRGNPNWVATTPREGFFLLGQFAMVESRRTMELPAGVGGMPKARGVAGRLDAWLSKNSEMPGADFLRSAVTFAVEKFEFTPDAFVHELVDSIVGDNYPVPDRMLVHNERIVREYLQWAMCGEPQPKGKFDLYAVEGGTAAMCYIFKSLKANRLLNPGDTIALGAPIFTPYLEMPRLKDYDLNVVHVRAPQENRFQYTDEELKKLDDPRVKAFFVVNPGNPTAMAMSPETLAKIAAIVRRRPRSSSCSPTTSTAPSCRASAACSVNFPKHDRRVFIFEVFRLHRLAPRRSRAAPGQHSRRAHCEAPRGDPG